MTSEMTAEEAVKQIKENCYFASISERTKQALDMAIKALEQRGCVWEIAYERGKVEVLDKIKALKAWDKVYQQIYDHHYEILKEEASEGRNAKLSLSNWILDLLTGYDYDIESEEVER